MFSGFKLVLKCLLSIKHVILVQRFQTQKNVGSVELGCVQLKLQEPFQIVVQLSSRTVLKNEKEWISGLKRIVHLNQKRWFNADIFLLVMHLHIHFARPGPHWACFVSWCPRCAFAWARISFHLSAFLFCRLWHLLLLQGTWQFQSLIGLVGV